MVAQIFFLFDITDIDTTTLEIASALLHDNEGLIGITEDKEKVSFCFETELSRQRAIGTINDFNAELNIIVYNQETKNWNKIWEDNFEPVTIQNFCSVIAPHHKHNQDVKHCIIINPEMSFGTGHHETTAMMIDYISELNINGMRVLDFGCGTGVLALLAEKEMASVIDAIDYDDLCISSTKDNANRNKCGKISVKRGDVESISGRYNIIFANVNRKVLLEAQTKFSEALTENGQLIISGILSTDEEIVKQKYAETLTYVDMKSKGDWLAIRYINDHH